LIAGGLGGGVGVEDEDVGCWRLRCFGGLVVLPLELTLHENPRLVSRSCSDDLRDLASLFKAALWPQRKHGISQQ